MDQHGSRVVVAMLTFRREHLLRRVLPELLRQAVQLEPPAEVVVVDNDPAGSARGIASDHPVGYLHEPRAGIAYGRNRALDYASHADALVFIDDDEIPTEHWLRALVEAWQRWQCAAVTGPAVAELVPGAGEPWALASGMFDPVVRPSGAELRGAATNNLLLDMATVRRLGLRFDEATALTGGEDTLFTHALTSRGGRIRWCQEAAVQDPIPAERITRAWVLRRTFRAGTTWTRMELSLARSRRDRSRTVASLLGRGIARSGLATLQLLAGLIRRDLAARARAERTIVSYAGLLAGLAGRSHDEYHRDPDVRPSP